MMLKRKLQHGDDRSASSMTGNKRSRHEACQEAILNTPKKKLRHEDYTVGWICPLEVEQIPAMEMLDDEHERLPQPTTDHNVYNLGSIGGHNVVIAGLHQPGNNPAATVVTQMKMTFPNLRFGLLVGIGGGVPVKTDNGMIRLGDIVVSKPADGHSGAVQYDHGKAETGQFRRTGAIAPPPAVLLNAAQDLAAKRARTSEDPVMRNIKRINTDISGLRKYKHPGVTHDYLYSPDYIHLDAKLSCDKCGCDPTQRVQRDIDEDESDEPHVIVHRGAIASGELLVKNGALRDQLAEEYGVLCFEMEAAGALANFPCLIIRGISDYCDSHKNNQWHGFSAAVAAAYARQLFFHMPVDEVKRYITSVTEEGIKHLTKDHHDQERQRIADWLTPAEYGAQQSDFIGRRQKGTCQWLLNSGEFQSWLNESKQTLFCPGIPGAGKTIITSIVVDNLCTRFQNDASFGIAYIYCNFRRQQEQQSADLLASLLKQLIQGLASVPQSMRSLYESHQKKRTRPSFDEISKVLHSVITDYSRTFIIIDALDECQVSDESRQRLLAELFSLQAKTGINVFATSRFIPDIMAKFKFEESLFLEIRASNEDVRKYLDDHISKLPLCVSQNRDLQEKIRTEIMEAVDGMFLLAQLHLDSLIDKTTTNKIIRALEKLPKGSEALDYAYKEAMKRIEDQREGFRDLAKRVLSWITHAKRPLTTLEIRHALAVEIGEVKFDPGNLEDIQEMVSVCAGLITIDEKSDVMRLVHYTTQEYFERTQTDWFPNAQKDLAATSITYLLFNAFETGSCLTDNEFEMRLQLNPLYDYAARNWGHHVRAASTDMEQSILEFFKSEAKVSASSQAMMASNKYRYPRYSQDVPGQMTGVHLAAYFGLKETTIVLLESRYDPDIKDNWDRTPLSWAIENGHEAVVRLLLARADVEVNSKDTRYGQTPLSRAAENGHEAVVRLLLARADVEPDSKDQNGQTPLSRAAEKGHEAVVRLLLARADVEPDSKDNWYGQTPLSRAAEKGHEAVVRLLLARADVEPDSKDKGDQTPLSRAAENGHEAVVKLLQSHNSQTPLSRAAENWHEVVVKLLQSHNSQSP